MVTEKEKVSIVIPVYNVEQYVEECINSVEAQTYNNLEIIIVNDGSTDNSGDICLEFMKHDSRIKVIRQENGGLSCACNTGLRHATGDLIMFLDSDDKYYPWTVEHMTGLLKRENADIVIFNFSGEEQFNQDEIYYKTMDNIGALKNLFRQKDNDTKIRCSTITRCTKIYRKEILDNIVFPEGRIFEDESRVHEILYRAKKVVYTNEICCFIRLREGSINHSTFSIKNLDKLQAFLDRVKFMEKIKQQELLKLSCNKYVSLFIQIFADKDAVTEKKQYDEIVKQLEKYYDWIHKYWSCLSLQSKVKLILYKCFPAVLKRVYRFWHKIKNNG